MFLKTKMVKSLLAASFLFSGSSLSAQACSELDAQDFKISDETQKTCGNMAKKYALHFAQQMVKIEKSEANYRGPLNNFTFEEGTPKFYKALTRSGNSKLIGFNVGLDSKVAKNTFECTFCVDMSLDDKGACKIESIQKHMCAN